MHAIPVLCNVYWIVELLRVVVIIRILQVSILVNPDTENRIMAGLSMTISTCFGLRLFWC